MPSSPDALPPRLVVADQHAGAVRVLDLPSGSTAGSTAGQPVGDQAGKQAGKTVGGLDGVHLSEHAGFLALPGGRTAFVDDRAGELIVLDPYGPERGRPLVAASAPVATPAEHLAADPSGRLVVVTTGLGRNELPWSEVTTVVDLGAAGGPRAVRVRTRAGEPGAVVVPGDGEDPLEGWVVLRHREPGAFTVHRSRELLAAGPGCPPAPLHHELPLSDDDGHGDAYDPVGGRLFAAAGSGVHRARRTRVGLVAEPALSWQGRGRGYFLRFDAARRTLWSCVRGGPADPARWPEWTNCAWWHRPDQGRTGRLPLGPGLVFRFAVAARHLAFARVHPDGDELVLVDAETVEITGRIPLPAMAGRPRAGDTPWDGAQRRAIAASPAHDLVAVSRGGHGEIQLVDAAAGASLGTLTVSTPLDDGGRLALVSPGDGAERDTVGR
ncbi:hypothetical protein [Streptomyces yaizuensis]|uniref:Uncharacterized protein n=1 Tax=Streptomyces yaizuensis TaxID=2989713 RepID=A0ABQ5NXB8_9ACTN|nr:hypothetical protein [Streptomyces sp. YSPA8]GLF95010.1 hypothetical protein SYYSPA8_11955 [Streptomyces sp. YSPA8]